MTTRSPEVLYPLVFPPAQSAVHPWLVLATSGPPVPTFTHNEGLDNPKQTKTAATLHQIS